jgi:glycosyltransferase involved in cell wall biosynthesis
MIREGKIKVLESIRQGQIGGGESHLLNLLENLDRSRFQPVVLSFTDGPMIERLNRAAVNCHVIHTVRPFDVSKWRRVKSLLRDEGIDLVHAHGTRACSNSIWAARSLGIPVIYTIHGWSFHNDQHPLLKRLRILGERYLTSKTALNISVSASNKQSGKEYIPNFESVVINNGIDQKRFSPRPANTLMRGELNIAPEVLLLIFIARFTFHKQPLTLIKAFKEALEQLPAMYLLMVGDGDEKLQGIELVKQWGLERKVGFLSFRQDVPELLAAADIFVLPSLWEGQPIGLLEAMAMGKAVIATRVDGTREIVNHEENGLLVAPGSVGELASALVRMGRSVELRKSFGQHAFETVQEKFSAADMTREIERVYTELLG